MFKPNSEETGISSLMDDDNVIRVESRRIAGCQVLYFDLLENVPALINEVFEDEVGKLPEHQQTVVVVDATKLDSAEGRLGDFSFLARSEIRNKISGLVVIRNKRDTLLGLMTDVLGPIVAKQFLGQKLILIESVEELEPALKEIV